MRRDYLSLDPQPYRIGWGRLPRMVRDYRRLVPMIVKGRQGDGQKVQRRRWLPRIRRDLRTLVTRNPKYLLHLPWMAEAEGQRFARRGLTPAAASRRMRRDVEYQRRTGRRSRYQAYRCWRATRWDRRNLPAREETP